MARWLLSLVVLVFAVGLACGRAPLTPVNEDGGAGGSTGTAGGTATAGGEGTGGSNAAGGEGGAGEAGGEGGAGEAGGTGGSGEAGGEGGAGEAGGEGGAGEAGGTGGSAQAGGTGGGTSVDAGVPVRFIAIGDSGKGNTGQFKIGEAMGTVCAAHGCDFVVMLGDNFYPSGVSSTTDPQWQTAFVQPYAPVDVPFYASLGNHDNGGDGLGSEPARGQHQVDYSQVNPKWRMPARYYKWRTGDVEFFAADTNQSFFKLDGTMRSDFNTWLPASTARWKIVFGHHPYKSNGRHGNAGSYDGVPWIPIANGEGVQEFIEDHVCGRADFYLAGHDHNVQWLQATCTRSGSTLNTGLIVSGGAASTTTLEGNQPTYYQTDALAFVYIVIDGGSFTATFYDEDAQAHYTRTVTK